MNHLVLSNLSEFSAVVSGDLRYLIRSFKKRPDFFGKISKGDLVYLKIGKEIKGQFLIKKLVLIENFEGEDLNWIKKMPKLIDSYNDKNSDKILGENSIIVVVQIDRFEQLITSPIEVPIVRKDWIILED